MAPLAPGEVVDTDEVADRHTPFAGCGRSPGREIPQAKSSFRCVESGSWCELVSNGVGRLFLQCGSRPECVSSSRQAKAHHRKSALSLCS